LVVFDARRIGGWRFLTEWSRVEAFGGHPPAIVSELEAMRESDLSVDALAQLIESEAETIRFTAPKPSILLLGKLLDWAESRMLVNEPVEARTSSTETG
jgi:hypothetical protein